MSCLQEVGGKGLIFQVQCKKKSGLFLQKKKKKAAASLPPHAWGGKENRQGRKRNKKISVA